MAQRVSKIQEGLRTLQRKEQASITLAIDKLPPEAQHSLQTILNELNAKTNDPEKSVKQKKKEESAAKFIGRIKAWLETVKDEKVIIKTDFNGCDQILCNDVSAEGNEGSLLAQLAQLKRFIGDLEVLKALAVYKKGEIIERLKVLGLTNLQVAQKTGFSVNYVERLSNYFKFVQDYKMLIFSGYSFETVLKYKAAIEAEANGDLNFQARLTVDPTVSFDFQEKRQQRATAREKFQSTAV